MNLVGGVQKRDGIRFLLRAGAYLVAFSLPLHGMLIRFLPRIWFWKESTILVAVYLIMLSSLLLSAKASDGKVLRFPKGTVDKVLLWFILYVVIRALTSPDVLIGLIGLGTYTMYVFFYFVTVWTFNERSITRLKLVIILSAVIVAGIGIVQAFLSPTTFGLLDAPMPLIVGGAGGIQVSRLTSAFGSPLYYGIYLALILPVVFIWFLVAKGVIQRLGSLSVFLILSLNLVLTFTRAAWVQAFLSILLVLVISLLYRAPRRRLLIWGCGVLLLGLAFLGILGGLGEKEDLVLSKVMSVVIKRGATIGVWSSEVANVRRMEAWKESLALLDNPQTLLFGIGPGLTQARVQMRYPKLELMGTESYYLQILVELGIIGLMFFLLIIFFFIKKGITIFLQARDLDRKLWVLGIVSAIFGLAVSSLIASNMNSWEISAVFWFYCAWLSILERHRFQKRNMVHAYKRGIL